MEFVSAGEILSGSFTEFWTGNKRDRPKYVKLSSEDLAVCSALYRNGETLWDYCVVFNFCLSRI